MQFARCLCAVFALSTSQAYAAETQISVHLDNVKQMEAACRLTFVAQNAFEQDVNRIVLETVAFDTKGSVASMTLFDFQKIPAGSMRVRQFDLPNMSCAALGSLLVNGVQTCESDVDCEDALTVSSRTDVALQG
ncbi:hypothetical protein CEP88_10165 [Roseobacter denitrificans]|uniref:Tat pathway signal sequence domain protein n=1 Tax=Roseobacter denitrificans (strain ATCC 33942 / OCh 114) TaxID=375451 RepID=Q160G0_ROSDO|nr:hypothetical protein [Roseobacter denitrificans]ABG33633.1 conserved hypothetical protein [Roseobacter denitrificans OCh 114]AVL52930.1 hypothetical protein CEP88_10165 [Roseobacter denitrificans]SFG03336.1 hypothetical protein SAMN05443635_10642 [Roseobacter denitrificans OCh 114]